MGNTTIPHDLLPTLRTTLLASFVCRSSRPPVAEILKSLDYPAWCALGCYPHQVYILVIWHTAENGQKGQILSNLMKAGGQVLGDLMKEKIVRVKLMSNVPSGVSTVYIYVL